MTATLAAKCVAMVLALQTASTPNRQPRPIDALAPLVGEWEISATWSDGAGLKARATYEWGPGRLHLICRTYLPTDTGEYLRYHDVLTYDAKEKALVDYSFAIDGSLSKNRITAGEAGRLVFERVPPEGGMTTLRQTLEFTSADAHRWLVEVWDAKANPPAWKTLMDGVWTRRK
jgi:hypothetical protein